MVRTKAAKKATRPGWDKAYIPDRGDIVWLQFDPQAGREQMGHRPALVVSRKLYNKTGMFLCCPMTTKVKGYGFEVVIDESSAILADQVRCLDWRAREARFKEKAPAELVDDVVAKIQALLE